MPQIVLARSREQVKSKAEELGLGFTELRYIDHPEQLHGWARGTVIWTMPGWEIKFSRNELDMMHTFMTAAEFKLVPAPTGLHRLLTKLINFLDQQPMFDERTSQPLPRAQSCSLTRAEAAQLAELLSAQVNDSDTLKRLFHTFRQREALGRKKYGTDVDRADLSASDWRQHIYEELLDAVVYATREKTSRD